MKKIMRILLRILVFCSASIVLNLIRYQLLDAIAVGTLTGLILLLMMFFYDLIAKRKSR